MFLDGHLSLWAPPPRDIVARGLTRLLAKRLGPDALAYTVSADDGTPVAHVGEASLSNLRRAAVLFGPVEVVRPLIVTDSVTGTPLAELRTEKATLDCRAPDGERWGWVSKQATRTHRFDLQLDNLAEAATTKFGVSSVPVAGYVEGRLALPMDLSIHADGGQVGHLGTEGQRIRLQLDAAAPPRVQDLARAMLCGLCRPTWTQNAEIGRN